MEIKDLVGKDCMFTISKRTMKVNVLEENEDTILIEQETTVPSYFINTVTEEDDSRNRIVVEKENLVVGNSYLVTLQSAHEIEMIFLGEFMKTFKFKVHTEMSKEKIQGLIDKDLIRIL